MATRYSFASINYDNITTCFQALNGIIKPQSIQFFIDFDHENLLTDIDKIAEELKGISSPLPILTFWYKCEDEKRVSIKFSRHYSFLEVSILYAEEDLTTQLEETIAKILELIPPTQEDLRQDASELNIYTLLWSLYDDVQVLRDEVISYIDDINSELPFGKLSCFCSFRFDDHSKALAFDLESFLSKIGIDVNTGLGYEPRDITEKILSRLNKDLDFFIIIFSKSGESAWIQQEIGIAKAYNLPIIILLEEGAECDLGMLKGIEYLKFPEGIISQTFIGLLDGIQYVINELEQS